MQSNRAEFEHHLEGFGTSIITISSTNFASSSLFFGEIILLEAHFRFSLPVSVILNYILDVEVDFR